MAQGQMSRVIDRVRRAALVQNRVGMTDGELLECYLADGSDAAFEALVRRHAAMVLGVCRRVVGHAQDAEDAFQATFVVLVRKANSVVPREAVGNWLYGVAYRTALEARARGARRRSREKQVKNMPETASRAASAAGSADVWCDLQPLLDRELSRLPDKYRLPVVLCDLEGRCREEVSQQLDLPEGTLSSRLARGRRMLAGRLARRGLALSAGTLAMALTQMSASAGAPVPLVVSTIQAATMVAAGQAATTAFSASVAALTEGVLHAMFMTKVKTATLVLLTVALFGSGAGLVTHRVLAGSARTPDPVAIEIRQNDTAFVGREGERTPPTLAGRVAGVAKDGKSFIVETQPAGGGRDGGELTPAKTIDVKLGADTKVVYSGVGLGGAKLTVGYGAQVWIADGSKDVATRVHFNGKQAERNAPNLTGRVDSVAKDGKTISFKLTPRGRDEPATTIDVQLTDKTTVLYTNVGKGGARPTEGYQAEVWLVDGSKSMAGKVAFTGSVEKFSREVPEAKPDVTGKVVGVMKDVLIVHVPPANRGDEAVKQNVNMDDKTSTIYFRIAADGDRPTDGYMARIWLAEGSKDTAGKIHFQAPDRQERLLRGKVIGIAKDGKGITLEQPGKERGDPPGSVDVKLAPKTRLVFQGVGPEGAALSEGLGAVVFLDDGSTDTAAVVVLSPAPQAGVRNER